MSHDPDPLDPPLTPSQASPEEGLSRVPVPGEAPRSISPGAEDMLNWGQALPQDEPLEKQLPLESRPSRKPTRIKSVGFYLGTSLVTILLAGAATIVILLFASRVVPDREPLSLDWIPHLLNIVKAPFDKLQQQVEGLRDQPVDVEKLKEQGQKIEPPGNPAEPPSAIERVKALNEQADKIGAWLEETIERLPSFREILDWLRQWWEQILQPD